MSTGERLANTEIMRAAVRDVHVGGREVMSDGRLTDIDEEDLAARAAARSFSG